MKRHFLALLSCLFLVLLVTACQPSPVDDDKLAKIIMHEDYRNADMEFFNKLLLDGNPNIRARACIALGRIGFQEAPDKFTERLEKVLLEDPSGHVRAMAAFALGEAMESSAVSSLLEALKDDDEEARIQAAEAISKVGNSEHGEQLAELLKNEKSVQVKARVFLTSWRLQNFETAKVAATQLLETNEELIFPAIYHLTRHEYARDVQLQPAVLMSKSSSEDPEVRKCVVRLLPGVEDPQLIQALLDKLLMDEDDDVKINAIRAASMMGYPGVLPAAQNWLDSENPQLRMEAIQAMRGFIGRYKDRIIQDEQMLSEFINLINKYFSDPEEVVAAMSIQAGIELGEKNPFADKLAELSEDGRAQVRGVIIPMYANLPEEEQWAYLDKAVEDEKSLVRIAATEFIKSIKTERAEKKLLELLEGDDSVIVAIAADYFQTNTSAEAHDQLLLAYKRLVEKADVEAMGMILVTLAAFDTQEARDLVLDAVENAPTRTLRMTAARVLSEEFGPEIFDKVGTSNLDRDVDFYKTVLAEIRSKPLITFKTNKGEFTLRFETEHAPMNVYNIMSLAKNNYFDGITIHRVVPDFVAQMGCPRGDGWGGPGYEVRCEINTLVYERGSVGMALSGKDTGGSQLFITYAPTPHLDGGYTIFAKVESGFETIDSLVPGDTIESVSFPEVTE